MFTVGRVAPSILKSERNIERTHIYMDTFLILESERKKEREKAEYIERTHNNYYMDTSP